VDGKNLNRAFPGSYDGTYTDVLARSIFDELEGLSGKKYGSTLPKHGTAGESDQEKIDIAFRVIADHIRTLSFAIADGIIRVGPELGFVPDRLIGHDPEEVKRPLACGFRALTGAWSVEHLLCSHGEPVVGSGRGMLAAFADAGAREDPLVAGIEDGGQVVVAEDRRRQALAPAGNRRVHHWGAGAHDGTPRIAGPSCGT